MGALAPDSFFICKKKLGVFPPLIDYIIFIGSVFGIVECNHLPW